MSSKVKERFRGQFLAANSTTFLSGITGVSGFLATTDGDITVSYLDGGNGATVATVTPVQAVPVAAGGFTLIPLEFAQNGGTVTLAGGASGTIFI